MGYINVNGKLTEAANAAVPHDNRAFRYGHGLFETMLVLNGQIQLSGYHWQRLFDGAKHLYMSLPVLLTNEKLEEEVLRTVQKNNLDAACRVRLQLYAGSGGLYDTGDNATGYIVECFPLDIHMIQLNEAGLVLGIAEGIYKSPDALANYKTSNALIYAIAARQARDNKWNDALVKNTQGNIIESTIANIFWYAGGTLFTTPLADGCIAGVMRRYIMERVPVTEASLTHEILQNADAVFLTNAIRRIKWVRAVNDEQFAIGSIHTLYRQLFD